MVFVFCWEVSVSRIESVECVWWTQRCPVPSPVWSKLVRVRSLVTRVFGRYVGSSTTQGTCIACSRSIWSRNTRIGSRTGWMNGVAACVLRLGVIVGSVGSGFGTCRRLSSSCGFQPLSILCRECTRLEEEIGLGRTGSRSVRCLGRIEANYLCHQFGQIWRLEVFSSSMICIKSLKRE